MNRCRWRVTLKSASAILFALTLLHNRPAFTADASDAYTLDVFSKLQTIDGLQISPDGTRLLATVRRMLPEHDAVERRVWLIDINTSQKSVVADRLLPDRSQAVWSPDGKRILSLSGTFTRPELVLLSIDSGKRKTLFAGDVFGYAWAPDGKSIAAIATPPLPSTRQPGIVSSSEEAPAAKSQLFIINAESGVSESLVSDMDLDTMDPSWSPNGKQIAFGAGDDLYVIDVTTRQLFPLVKRAGADRHPVWSPDGSKIAFASQYGTPGDPFAISIIAPIADAQPADKYSALDTGFGSDDPRFIGWSRDGKSIYVTVLSHMKQNLVRLDLKSGASRNFTSGDGVFYDFSFTSDLKKFACINSSPSDPGALVDSPITSFAPHRIRWDYPELNGVALPTTSVIKWTSSNGFTLEGLLMKPASAASKYPLVILTEGSHGTFDLSFTTRVSADTASAVFPFQPHVLAGNGYAVFMPNVRGSWGFGQEIRKAIRHDPAKGPYDDLMSGIDQVLAHGLIDSDRISILAVGYDAYRAAYALTKTTRFKAAVLGEPLGLDLISFYSNPYFGFWVENSVGGPPWEKTADYIELSPLLHVNSIKTPVLMFCMQSQPPIAVQQCNEFHTALDKIKTPNELLTQTEDPSHFGEDRSRSYLELMRKIVAWIDRWNNR